MKKFFSLFAALLFAGSMMAETYTKTDFANLQTGDVVIVTMQSGDNIYAASNDQGTSAAPKAVAVTVADDAITTDSTNILWTVVKDGSNISFQTGDNYLYCTNSNNGMRVGTNSNKVFSIDATSGYLFNNATSRYIGVYNSQDWRCYTSVNSNIKDQALTFFAKSNGGAPEPIVVTKYYLVGSMNNWTPAEGYQFKANAAASGEYMFATTLALNDEFKVVGVNGETQTWYPDGMGNNYVVDAEHAGEVTIYFRPEGNVEGWYEGYFYVAPVPKPKNLGPKTIAEFLELKNDFDTCVLTGVVDSIANTTYGNLYLSDATATVYVYGVLNAAGESKKFAELGVEVGDTLTILAQYNEYKGAPQVKNAIFVEVKKAVVIPEPIVTSDTLAVEFTAPGGAPEAVEIIGSFSGWQQGVALELKENIWTGTIVATAKDEFKFRKAGTWDVEIQVYDAENDFWTNCGNLAVKDCAKEGKLIVNFSDENKYRWTPAAQPEDTTVVPEPEPVDSIPTPALLDSLYDITKNVVYCIQFIEDAKLCNNVYFVGSANNWGKGEGSVEAWENCAKFAPVPGFEGWYAVALPYAEGFQGKPLQEPSDHSWTWDYQCGDAAAWVYVRGERLDIMRGFDDECDIAASAAGAYIYQLKYWKKHRNPCAQIEKKDYTITLYAPDACPEMKPAIIGDFNNWAEGIAMKKDSLAYIYTLNDVEGHAFKIKEVNDVNWYNEILYYDAENDEWTKFNNIELGAETNIVLDWSNNDKYRFALCDGGEPQPQPLPTLPVVALAGSMNNWVDTVTIFVPAADSLSASATIELSADNYEFKMVVGGHWLAKDAAYELKRGQAKVDSVDQEIGYGPNLILVADIAGKYTFTWTYATNSLEVTFPDSVPATKMEVQLIAPAGAPDSVEIMGSFNGWEEGVLLQRQGESWTGVIVAKASDEFKFRKAGTWATEIQVYNAEFGGWYNPGNFLIKDYLKENKLFVNFSDTAMYRWTPAAQPEDTTVVPEPEPVDSIPTPALLDSLYDITKNVVYCIQFIEDAKLCNNVYFVGSANNWGKGEGSVEAWENCAKFAPVPGFEGWYAVALPYAEGFQGKPLQEPSDHSWTWDYQCGDAAAWVYVRGERLDIMRGFDDECDIAASAAGAYIYQLKYWKKHRNPCAQIEKKDYTITLYAPDACPEMKPAIIGDFNNWAEGIAMKKDSLAYIYTLNDVEGHAFKIKEVNDVNWYNEILYYDAENDEWTKFNNIELGAETNIVLDWSNNDKYRFALCDGGEPQPQPLPTLPVVALAGSMNNWVDTANVFTPAADSLSASATIELSADNYEFKMVVGGRWLAKDAAYELKRGQAKVDSIDQEIGFGPNLILVADIAGKYTFTWTYASNTLEVIFPDSVPATKMEVQLIAPAGAPDSVEIMGSFNEWQNGVLLQRQGESWTGVIVAKASDEFKFRKAGTWATEIQVYNAEFGGWYNPGNFLIKDYLKENKLFVNFSDTAMYRWTPAAQPEDTTVIPVPEPDTLAVQFLAPAGAPDSVEIIGSFCGWNEGIALQQNGGVWTGSIVAAPTDFFKFRKAGDVEWKTEVQILYEDGMWYNCRDLLISDYTKEGKLFVDFSDTTKYRWTPAVQPEDTTVIPIDPEPEDTIPTVALLGSLYDLTTNVVYCIQFVDEATVCRDIRFVGTTNNWGKGSGDTEAWDNCAKFAPVPGFEGWYAAALPYVSGFQGKPIQETEDRTWSWDYQCGDAAAWTYVGGERLVFMSNGIQDECNIAADTAGAYIYQLSYWKKHKNPCEQIVKKDYLITIYAPNACSDMKPAIIGDFNNWKEGIAMTEGKDGKGNVIYTYTLTEEEGRTFKIKEASDTDWSNEIQYYDVVAGAWYVFANIELGAETNIVFDWSDNNLYRFALCQPVTYYAVTFLDWNGQLIEEQVVEEGKAAVAPADPSRDGYVFTGWSANIQKIEARTYAVALYEKEQEPGLPVYFVDKDNKVIATLQIVGEIPEAPVVEKMSFTGWETVSASIENGITIIATYEDEQIQGIPAADSDDAKAYKVMYNGQVYIVRGNKMYTLTGDNVK